MYCRGKKSSWQKKSCTGNKKDLLAEKSPPGRKKVLLVEKVLFCWKKSSNNIEKAVRSPQPKQGLETYHDYKKKQSMKELNEELGDRVFNEQQ